MVLQNCLCAVAATFDKQKSPKQRNSYNQKWPSDANSIEYSLLLMTLVGEGEENCSPGSNISNTISFSIRLKHSSGTVN